MVLLLLILSSREGEILEQIPTCARETMLGTAIVFSGQTVHSVLIVTVRVDVVLSSPSLSTTWTAMYLQDSSAQVLP